MSKTACWKEPVYSILAAGFTGAAQERNGATSRRLCNINDDPIQKLWPDTRSDTWSDKDRSSQIAARAVTISTQALLDLTSALLRYTRDATSFDHSHNEDRSVLIHHN
ncbi:hypothetical protein E4U53_003410 [Claviceps sorghi]|nr:hypothetical protein E4U53_003410 [Claviceps sorghi]